MNLIQENYEVSWLWCKSIEASMVSFTPAAQCVVHLYILDPSTSIEPWITSTFQDQLPLLISPWTNLSCTSVETPLGAVSLRVGNIQTQISNLQLWKRGHYLNSIWATVIEVNHTLPKITRELNLEIEDAAVEEGWFCCMIMSQQTASRFLYYHLDCADVFQWCHRCQGKIWLQKIIFSRSQQSA